MRIKVIQVISWIILALALTGCVSHPRGEKKEIPVITVETIYFPSFTDSDTEIADMLIPYWYWNLIIDYVEETEAAVTSLTAQHPP